MVSMLSVTINFEGGDLDWIGQKFVPPGRQLQTSYSLVQTALLYDAWSPSLASFKHKLKFLDFSYM